MDKTVITMDKEEAKKHYEEYLEVVKVRKEKYLEELKNLYRHLSEGAKVIDIYEAFKQAGVNEMGEPKLGIAPANCKEIMFVKESLGAGRFAEDRWDRGKTIVSLPSRTFPDWGVEITNVEKNWSQIVRETVKAKVPVIPATLLPDSKSLDGYYVLFEVAEWNEVPQKKDPYLLKRINANAFVVLAEWDVSAVELAIMRGQ